MFFLVEEVLRFCSADFHKTLVPFTLQHGHEEQAI